MRWAVAAAVLALGFVTHPVAVSQQPVFSSRAEVVRVDVLVLKDGRPMRNLAAADFEIKDNGVLQQVELLSAEALPLNVVLALDHSDSLTGTGLRDLQNAGRALIDGLTDRDGAALVTFGSAVTAASSLTRDLNAVRSALDRPASGGLTALIDGCFAGLMLGASELGRSLLLVFSDGLDTSSWLTADAVLGSAKRADVVTYGVVAGDKPRQSFLRDLTEATGGDVIQVGGTKDVGNTFLRLLDEYRQRYLLSYTPTGVARNGWHRIDVRVKQRNVTVRARPGYSVGS
jgi:Ca-activated chloride channel homolog